MDSAFISWHRCQRSRSLATRLSITLLETCPEGISVYRFGYCTIWTLSKLIKYRPNKIIIQNSFLLLTLVALYKTARGNRTIIICDCHTKALRRRVNGSLGSLFWSIKSWSFTKTDLCLIHNHEQVEDIEQLTKHYIVIPDPLPAFSFPDQSKSDPLEKPKDSKEICVFVCSYDMDEPIHSMLIAAKELAHSYDVRFTGNAPKCVMESHKSLDINFSGYLPDEEYAELLNSASVIIALTNDQACLQCAAYEALAIKRPLVTSDTKVLRNMLGNAAVYVTHEPEHIQAGVEKAMQDSEKLISNAGQIRRQLESEVNIKLQDISLLIDTEKHKEDGLNM